MSGPGTFKTAGHGIPANPPAGFIEPAQALIFHLCAFGGRAQQFSVAVTMRFTHGMTACGQGYGFFIIHCHSGEGYAYIFGGSERVGFTINPFRIDVDQPHHDGCQRIFQIPFTGITAVGVFSRGEPFFFRSPIDVFLRMPDVFTTKTETEGL